MKTLKNKLCDCVLLLCLLFYLVFQTMTDSSTRITKESVPVEPVSTKAAAMPLELDKNQIAIEHHVIGISTTKQEYLEEIIENSNDVPPEEVKPVDWHQKFMEMVRKFDGMGIYDFGSKASVSDFENANKYINGEITSDAFSLRLDCSGFVTWVFINAMGDPSYANVIGHGASNQYGKCKKISWREALPGDLVFYPDLGHVGVIVGIDENGNLLVAHCASSQNNVVVTGVQGFTKIGRRIL